MTSLQVRKATRRMHTMLIYGFGGLALLALGLALFVPSKPWASALVGLGAGAAMFAVSWLTTGRAAASAEPSVGWVALDYLIKVGLTLGVLVVAKSVDSLEVGVVAALLIAAIALTAGIQVAAFAPVHKGRETADSDEGR